ncbi:MAG: hypothetical protein ACI83O_000931 [Patescibacteria group bacterium]
MRCCMELVAVLSTGKGSWGQVAGLMRKGEWAKVIVVGPSFAKDFSVPGIPFDFIEYDSNASVIELKKFFGEKLKGKFDEMEVAVSIASGNGKEHMALLSALLSVPVGIRFSALTKTGIIVL